MSYKDISQKIAGEKQKERAAEARKKAKRAKLNARPIRVEISGDDDGETLVIKPQPFSQCFKHYGGRNRTEMDSFWFFYTGFIFIPVFVVPFFVMLAGFVGGIIISFSVLIGFFSLVQFIINPPITLHVTKDGLYGYYRHNLNSPRDAGKLADLQMDVERPGGTNPTGVVEFTARSPLHRLFEIKQLSDKDIDLILEFKGRVRAKGIKFYGS